jgi:hypothetical protein
MPNALTGARLVSDKQLDLDKHRDMAEQKATDVRRILADVENKAKDLRDRQGILENQLLSAPAVSWPEAAAKARYVLRRHGRLLGQHLRELVRGIAEQGSDHHRDNEQDQRVGERGRDRVLQWAGGRRGGWLVQRVRHKRSVTVDVGRYHGSR